MVITILSVVMFFDVLGLVGSIKEHLCMTASFVALQGAFCIIYLIQFLFNGFKLWGTPTWTFLVAVVGLIFVRDLYLIRREARLSKTVVAKPKDECTQDYVY